VWLVVVVGGRGEGVSLLRELRTMPMAAAEKKKN
jgi:hypothetical protein